MSDPDKRGSRTTTNVSGFCLGTPPLRGVFTFVPDVWEGFPERTSGPQRLPGGRGRRIGRRAWYGQRQAGRDGRPHGQVQRRQPNLKFQDRRVVGQADRQP